jgi:hypothetical protein
VNDNSMAVQVGWVTLRFQVGKKVVCNEEVVHSRMPLQLGSAGSCAPDVCISHAQLSRAFPMSTDEIPKSPGYHLYPRTPNYPLRYFQRNFAACCPLGKKSIVDGCLSADHGDVSYAA